jgi:uncharacterized protein (TIGR03083 family)
MRDARSFAEWVVPVAAKLAADRAAVIEFARSVPPGDWSRPTGDPGWSCKDILAHLAGGNDQLLQTILRAVTAREPVAAAALDPDTDAENARRVAERRPWTVGQLIAELVRDGDEVQQLLSRLSDDDRARSQPGSDMTLGRFLRIVHDERHDDLHLRQLRQALPHL